jgi:hypothetical protein
MKDEKVQENAIISLEIEELETIIAPFRGWYTGIPSNCPGAAAATG